MSARAFSILDAISDQRLFGPAFRDLKTWRAWLVFLAGLFALPMSAEQAEVWRECTGRSTLPQKPFTEACGWCTGGGQRGLGALADRFDALARRPKPWTPAVSRLPSAPNRSGQRTRTRLSQHGPHERMPASLQRMYSAPCDGRAGRSQRHRRSARSCGSRVRSCRCGRPAEAPPRPPAPSRVDNAVVLALLGSAASGSAPSA